MATVDVREVLNRLSRGEITAEQADAELGASDADETSRLADPERSSAESEWEPTRQLNQQGSGIAEAGSPSTVRGSLNGSGHLLVVGAWVECPEVHGPASISIVDDAGTFTIRGGYGDGSELIVPADADLQLEVNGGGVTLTNLRGTLRGDFNVGDVSISGVFDRGMSVINANAGPVVVTLAEGSDVRVMLRSGCESTVDPSISRTGAGEWMVGGGRSALTIQGNLGELILRDSEHG